MTFTCPSCDTKFKIVAVDHNGREVSRNSIISPVDLKAVYDFMVEIGPVKEGTTELYHAYNIRQGDRGWPALTREAFSRCLTRNGAEKWRNSQKRGYAIPDVGKLKRGSVAPTVADRLERESMQDAIAHSGDQSRRDEPEPPRPPFDTSDLPFDM